MYNVQCTLCSVRRTETKSDRIFLSYFTYHRNRKCTRVSCKFSSLSFSTCGSKTATARVILRWSSQITCVQNSHLKQKNIKLKQTDPHTHRSIVGVRGICKRFNHAPPFPQLVRQCEEDSLHMVGDRVILGARLKERHPPIVRPALCRAGCHHLIALRLKFLL